MLVPNDAHHCIFRSIYARLSDAGLVTRAGSGIHRLIRLIKQPTGNDIGNDIRDFEVLLTILRQKVSRLAEI